MTNEKQFSDETVKASAEIVVAIGQAIRELGSVPSGHLYTAVMSKLDIHAYNGVIRVLKSIGCVTERNNVLYWTESATGE